MSRCSNAVCNLLAMVLVGSIVNLANAFEENPLALSWLEDADLADVFFLDQDRGWAVGDRGVIWSTSDGGRRWQLQASGVTCRLESVHFVDQRNGWIVGGRSRPYSSQSTGVVLRTTDGGRHWSPIPRLQLPWLRKACFFDQKHGVAYGEATAMYPTGLFHTDDGGRTWVSTVGSSASDWLAGDFAFDGSGVLVAANQTAVIDDSRRPMQRFRQKGLGLRQVHDVELTLSGVSWLVGDNGTVLISHDGGVIWNEPQDRIRHVVRDQVDFRAVATAGRGCWIAGAPGSVVLHSNDEGKSWSAASTGQNAPIDSLFFLNDDRGWAVGAMGTILATRDGGRTWRSQRLAHRPALMAVFAKPAQVPFELLAQLSGDQGYRSVVEIVTRRDGEAEVSDLPAVARKTQEAVVLSGGSSASNSWRFPIRQPGLAMSAESTLRIWNQVYSGRAEQELEQHLVRQIRMWQPDVIVTHSGDKQESEPLGQLLQRSVIAAIEKAADPKQYVQQIEVGGLQAWSVKRVLGSTNETDTADVILVSAQFGPRLGRSLASQAARARAVLNDQHRPSPARLAFRVQYSTQSTSSQRQQWFDGLLLKPGGEARRVADSLRATSLNSLKRSAQRQRTIEQLLSGKSNPRTSITLLGQIGDLTKEMDDDSATGILFQLAQSYCNEFRFDLAAEVLQLLVRQYPDHDLVPPSLTWLAAYFGSVETAWQVERLGLSNLPSTDSFAGGQQNSQQYVSGTINFADYVREDSRTAQPQVVNRTVSAQQDAASHEVVLGQRARHATSLIKQMHHRWPTLHAEPEFRFIEATAMRNQRQLGLAERATRAFSNRQRRDAWADCARGEMWLRQPRDQPPKPMAKCVSGPTKPHLDGRFDDEIWKNAQPLRLHGQIPESPSSATTVTLARDSEFLYLAIQCQKANGAEYPAAQETRSRDPDLTQRDRVDIYLDLDRDYKTYYHLSVDHRGWVGDSFWGISRWDPKWYVASTDSNGGWTAEAAIPLTELTARPPTRRDVWAIGVQRTIPNVGFQSWSRPAAVQPRPEGFGYLSFD
jgi:photosystem II stability/assembly factor-like uncharacterized protein